MVTETERDNAAADRDQIMRTGECYPQREAPSFTESWERLRQLAQRSEEGTAGGDLRGVA